MCFTTKTCLYKVYPLKPHFYIVKLGLTGVCLFYFLIFDPKHILWVPTTNFLNKYIKNIDFFPTKFTILKVEKHSLYFVWTSFRNDFPCDYLLLVNYLKRDDL